MKKRFFLPLLAAFLLAGCNNGNSTTTPPVVDDEGGGGGQQTGNDGTLAKPYSVSEIKALCDKAGEGKFTAEVYVTGKFDAGTKVNTQYHQWEGYLDNGAFNVWSAALDSSISITETDGALDGKTIVVKGYAELYNGKYQIGYIKADISPTGKKYNPTIVKVEGSGTGGEGSGGEGSGGGNTDNLSSIAYDFTAAKSQCPEYAAGDKDVAKDITVSGKSFKEVNCYNSTNTSNFMMGANKYGSDSYVANQEAVAGSIAKIEIVVPSGASGNTRFHIGFGSSAMNAAYLDGEDVIPAKGSQSNLTSNVTLEINADVAKGYKYFNITAAYKAADAKHYNGSIATVTVYYK